MSESKIQSQTDSVLIDELFAVGAHYGYSRSRRHPSMKKVILGAKSDMEIINLDSTLEYLGKAKEFMKELGKGHKTVLFVGTKPQIRRSITEVAGSLSMPYVENRWIGGTFTNADEIQKRVKRLADLLDQKEKGELAKYTKKERLLIDREIEDLEHTFGGLTPMDKKKPDAIVIVDPACESIAVTESTAERVPIVAIANTDCSLRDVQYPIPANDSAIASVRYILQGLSQAYRAGLSEASREASAGVVKK